MSTPTPSLQSAQSQLLGAQFANDPNVTPDAVANLQSTINSSPVLINQLNSAVAAGHLNHFALLPIGANAGGSYDGNIKTMNLPLIGLQSPLTMPSSSGGVTGGNFNIYNMTFVLGHEIQHGFNHAAKTQAYVDFDNEAKLIAQSHSAQHDYTPAIGKLINANRIDESKAEIAAWNSLVSNVKQTNPTPNFEDIYKTTSRASDFIDRQGIAGSYTYTLKPGFTLNSDLSMAETPANIAAIGQSYFDKAPLVARLGHHGNSDYSNYYGAYAVGRASYFENTFAQPHQGVMPSMMINMTQLRLTEKLVEENGINLGSNATQASTRAYYDTSIATLALHYFNHSAVTHAYVPVLQQEPTASINQSRPDLIQSGHPDYMLYQQALAGVHKHDNALGRNPDENSERLAASLTLLAKENGISRIDNVVFSIDNGRGVRAGENVFVVQGELGNPAHDRAHMKTSEAISTSVSESFQKMEMINQQQTQQQLQQPAVEQTQAPQQRSM